MTALAVAVSGCSGSGEAAEEARNTAADAQVRAAEADERVGVLAGRRAANTADTRAVVPLGTVLKVILIDAIDSGDNVAGDRFLASLAEAVVVDGVTMLPKGLRIRGRVINAEGAARVNGRGAVRLELTDVTLRNGRMVSIVTNAYDATADSTQARDTAVIAGGAGAGAIIGAIANGKKGAAIGAVTGGAAGTGVVLATKGKEVHFDPETRLDFTLRNAVDL
jgi:hypothetical protein